MFRSSAMPFFQDTGTSGDMQSVDSINISGATPPALIQAKNLWSCICEFPRTISVNSAFTDGHVASNKRQQLKCVYIGDGHWLVLLNSLFPQLLRKTHTIRN